MLAPHTVVTSLDSPTSEIPLPTANETHKLLATNNDVSNNNNNNNHHGGRLRLAPVIVGGLFLVGLLVLFTLTPPSLTSPTTTSIPVETQQEFQQLLQAMSQRSAYYVYDFGKQEFFYGDGTSAAPLVSSFQKHPHFHQLLTLSAETRSKPAYNPLHLQSLNQINNNNNNNDNNNHTHQQDEAAAAAAIPRGQSIPATQSWNFRLVLWRELMWLKRSTYQTTNNWDEVAWNSRNYMGSANSQETTTGYLSLGFGKLDEVIYMSLKGCGGTSCFVDILSYPALNQLYRMGRTAYSDYFDQMMLVNTMANSGAITYLVATDGCSDVTQCWMGLSDVYIGTNMNDTEVGKL